MDRFRALAAMAAVAAAGLLAAMAQAQPASGPAGPGGLPPVLTDLGLTADQEAKLRQLIQNRNEETQNWQRENGPRMQELKEKMDANARWYLKDGARRP